MDTLEYKYVSHSIDTTSYNTDKINTKKYETNNVTYTILNNDATCITFDDEVLRFYRSVILDENNHLLSFAPPNSIELDKFVEKYPTITNEIYANEIIEGTMINLFYDNRIQSWEIATRGAIGGHYWYYRTQYSVDRQEHTEKQRTFREMFLDALRYNRQDSLNSVSLLQELPKQYCYSFVVQHPDNHIVLPISSPRLFLVSVYDLNEKRAVYIPPPVYEEWDCFQNSVVEFPQRYESASYDDLRAKYCHVQSEYSHMGIMFTNLMTAERAAMQNPVYEMVKKLRGNNPNLQYQYFCLKRANQLPIFFNYFSEYKNLFYLFEKQYQDFITNVHQSYFSYYVKKEGLPIAKKFFIHASKIHHSIYLPSLNSKDNNKMIITRKVVKEYMDSMEPGEILFHLNFDKRAIASEKNKNEINYNELPEPESAVEEECIASV